MVLTKHHWLLLAFTLGYILCAGWYFMSAGNYEFVWYIAVLLFFAGLIGGTLKKTNLPLWSLWLLSLWGFLHMLGGGLQVGDEVLYAYVVFPVFSDGGEFTLLKYDQLIHAYGFGMAALLIRHLLIRAARNVISPFWIGSIAVCASMGLGALNEIVEFVAVAASPETGVGGYYNTALDLVFNGLGAFIAVVVAGILARPTPSVEKTAVIR